MTHDLDRRKNSSRYDDQILMPSRPALYLYIIVLMTNKKYILAMERAGTATAAMQG